jgi:hypothetical protein
VPSLPKVIATRIVPCAGGLTAVLSAAQAGPKKTNQRRRLILPKTFLLIASHKQQACQKCNPEVQRARIQFAISSPTPPP